MVERGRARRGGARNGQQRAGREQAQDARVAEHRGQVRRAQSCVARRVHLVRGRDETCPVSTGGRGEGGGQDLVKVLDREELEQRAALRQPPRVRAHAGAASASALTRRARHARQRRVGLQPSRPELSSDRRAPLRVPRRALRVPRRARAASRGARGGRARAAQGVARLVQARRARDRARAAARGRRGERGDARNLPRN
jgi:hypothetical protein